MRWVMAVVMQNLRPSGQPRLRKGDEDHNAECKCQAGQLRAKRGVIRPSGTQSAIGTNMLGSASPRDAGHCSDVVGDRGER